MPNEVVYVVVLAGAGVMLWTVIAVGAGFLVGRIIRLRDVREGGDAWRRECTCDHPPLAHCPADEIEPGGCTATDASGALCSCSAAPSSHLRRP